MSYDENGSLTNDGLTRTFEWDAANRLTAINYTSGNRSEFTYDGLSRCVKIVEKTNGSVISTRKFVWCGNEKCEFRDANDAVTLMAYPQGQYVGVTKYFYFRDHLGSIREMMRSNGTLVARFDYDPWGRSTTVLNTTLPDFNFTGLYRHSASNLDLADYRAYDPDLGRWLSRDPISEGGGLNLYAYVNNGPVAKTDRLGLTATTAAERYGFVCCRGVRYEPGDPPRTWLAQKLSIRHCEIKSRCDPDEDAYVITKRNSGRLDTGKCCSEATRSDVLQCMARHAYYVGAGWIGSNCQTSVFETLASCCLQSEWVPSWYR